MWQTRNTSNIYKTYASLYQNKYQEHNYQKYIEDPLAEFILGQNPPEGSAFKAVMRKDGEGLDIDLEKEAKSESKK